MIRATFAVSVLLASIFVLSQNLVDSSNDAEPDTPQPIEVPVDDEHLQTPQPNNVNSTAFVPGEIELVDHTTSEAMPSMDTLAQRWGGRSNLRSRMRGGSNPPVVTPTRPWLLRRSQRKGDPADENLTEADQSKPITDNPNNLPMAKEGRPIPAPARVVPEAENAKPIRGARPKPKVTVQQPTPAQRTQQPLHEIFDKAGILDPADPQVQRSLPAPTPTRSPTDEQTQPNPVKQAQPAPIVNAKPRYFDDDWYQSMELSPRMLARKRRIAQTLDHYYRLPLNSKDHSPWSLMHTMIAWGSDSYIRAGGPQGRSVGTVHWLANNGLSDGVRLLYVQNNEIRARTGPGLQGHDGQFLAMLAQTRVRDSYPIKVDGREFTVRDVIELEKKTCRSDMELTFKLIGLSHYLAPDEVWRSETGRRWNIPKLINAEIAAPINGVTCGGTHRLMGLKYAVRMRRRAGMPVDGEWARAEKYTSDYVQLALRQQNDDGSFSSNFFRGRGTWGDNDRKLKTTGHLLEYVVFSVPHEGLRDRRITLAVDYLTSMLMNNRYYDWPKGPIGHAIRALSLYNERVFNIPPGHRRAAKMAQLRAEAASTKR